MSLKAKIEAVIYAAEEPVTLQQLIGLLGQEAQSELDAAAERQGQLALNTTDSPDEPEAGDQDALNAETLGETDTAAEEQPTSEEESPASTEAVSVSEPGPATSDEPPTSEPERTEPVAAGPGTNEPTAAADEPSRAEARARERRLRDYIRSILDALIAEYANSDRGLEVREVAGGFRFATKPEYHDAVRGFVRSLKPPLKLSLQALETLAVVAYKQPVTAPEVSEIRGVDSGGVLGSLMTRKLVTTAGRKQVIGRPILYKTTKEFLLRFGLKDLSELPSIEEFERLASDLNEAVQEEIPMSETPTAEPSDSSVNGSGGSTAADEWNAAPEPSGSTQEPVEDAARPASMQYEHHAQPDGLPDEETDAENLTPGPDGPGEFTGNESVPPADNVTIDGRLSGVPPTYDTRADESTDSPELDAEVQSEQTGNAGEDV